MKSKGEILRAHYIGLMRKAATWLGMVAMVLTTFAPFDAHAAVGLLTSRKATLSTSAAGTAAATATFVFNPSTTNSGAALGSVKFQLCDSPLESVTCAIGSLTGATMASATAGSQSGTGWTNQFATIVGSASATAVIFKNASNSTNSPTSGNAITFPVASIHLPNAANQQFYLRVTTYTGTDGATGETDFGGIAVSTTDTLNVTANVQESLVFCTGTVNTATCASMTYTDPIRFNTGGSTSNPLSSTASSYANAYMAASTNGSGGYAISYNGTAFTNTTATHTITAASSTGSVLNVAGGVEQFGFNVVSNATFGTLSTIGANPTPNAATSYSSGYGTAGSVAYNATTAVPLLTMTGANAATPNEYTISYGANIASTTESGTYTASQTFIATATF